MARFVIVLMLAAVMLGLLWPILTRLSRGRLAGDVVVECKSRTYYVPVVVGLVASLLIGALLWWFGH